VVWGARFRLAPSLFGTGEEEVEVRGSGDRSSGQAYSACWSLVASVCSG
jgi:hypothetical protein